jgi:hypothetical protein
MEVEDLSDQLTPQERTAEQLVQVGLRLGFQADALAERANFAQHGIASVSQPTAHTFILADNNPNAWLVRSTGEIPTDAATLLDTSQGGITVDETASVFLRPTGVAPGTSVVVALEQTVALAGPDGSPQQLTGIVPCGISSLSSDGTPHWEQVTAVAPEFMQPLVLDPQNPAGAATVLR